MARSSNKNVGSSSKKSTSGSATSGSKMGFDTISKLNDSKKKSKK